MEVSQPVVWRHNNNLQDALWRQSLSLSTITSEYTISIVRWENVKVQGQKKYTVYKTLVQTGSKKWIVYRRYNQFLEFHDALVKESEFSPLPRMPSKKAVGNRKSNFIEKRREKLEIYLKTLLQTHPKVVNSVVFKNFINWVDPRLPGTFILLTEPLVMRILSYLPPRDLVALSRVSWCFNRLAEDDTLWEPLTCTQFNCTSFLELETWKEQYKYYVENPPIELNPGHGGAPKIGGGNSAQLDDERRWISLYNFSQHPEPVKKRLEVLAEILTTEKDYVKDLDLLVNVFLFPLRARQILPENIVQLIFSNIEIIANTNKELLSKLEERMGKLENDVNIGDIFSIMAPFFKSYNVYCGHQATALDTFNKIKKENIKEFEQYLVVCESDTRCRGMNLFGFLIKPVQRICKYPLLFRELLKNTTSDHPDYQSLVDASEKIESVVSYVNEKKRFFEGLQKMIDIQHSIDGCTDLLQPTRKFEKDGVLALLKGNSIDQIYVFLFNDLVLLAKNVSQVGALINRNVLYKAKGQIPLDTGRLVNLSDTDEVKYAFELSVGKKKWTLCCATEDEKNDWVASMRRLIKEFQRRKYSSQSQINLTALGGLGATSSPGSPKRH